MKSQVLTHFLHFVTTLVVMSLSTQLSMAFTAEAEADTCTFVIDTTWVAELPIVELRYDESEFNSMTYIPASFSLHTVDTLRSYTCRIRRRGATSLAYAKANFALKFFDEEGVSKDVRFLGMRKDNNWILDGMASDYGKIRNRVSMDLWLDFSRKPYHQAEEPQAVNGFRGEYVEVYVNGSYYGLFCLMERVDRKQLKLKKFEPNADDSTTFHHRGLMYKACNGASTRTPYFYWQQNVPNNGWSGYDGMEAVYPDVDAGEPWDWLPLRNNIYFLAAYSGSYFTRNIGSRFDLPVFNDYILFIDLLHAQDNVGKNYYSWFYDQSGSDQRVGITPWDIDSSWGRNYRGSMVIASDVLTSKSNYFTRMTNGYAGFADTLAVRYTELRDSLWQEASLCDRFDHYFDLFSRTGAWQREFERWNGTKHNMSESMEEERQYIHEWIHDRLVFLDSLYGYEPPAAIRFPQSDEYATPSRCFDLMGRPLPQGAAPRSNLLYIQGRRKQLITQ